MTDDVNDRDLDLRSALPPIDLGIDAQRRIRQRLAVEVDSRRAALDSALYGGFAVAAIAWTLLGVIRP